MAGISVSGTASTGSENTTEMDCREITDPRAKKRLQNRVAQRSYRRRVKSQLAELQEKVAQYESTGTSMGGLESKKNTAIVSPPHQHLVSNSQARRQSLPQAPQRVTNIGPVDTPPSMPSSGLPQQIEYKVVTKNNDHSILLPRSSSASSLNVGNQVPDPTLAQAGAGYIHGGTNHQTRRGRSSSYVNDPQELGRDIQETQIAGGGGLIIEGFDTTHRHHNNSNQSPNSSLLQPFRTLTTAPTAATITAPNHPFNAGDLNGELDLSFLIENTEIEGWKAYPSDKAIEQTSRSPLEDIASSRARSATSNLPSYASSSKSSSVDSKATLDQRFQKVMECVGAVGFESFDELVSSYYGDDFEEASKLFHEQRFSRLRRLPAVFADILENSRRWKPSERQGLNEEVLKEAEAVLMLESNQAWKALQLPTDTAMVDHNILSDNLYQHLGTIIPTEMPSLWTLLMALVASDGPAWQRDCSGTALAITALLHLAGRIPKEAMLELVSLCLS